jgi:hypothetical protein
MASSKTKEKSGLTEYQREALRLLSENNALLKKNNSILKDNHDILVELQDNVRKIKFNTN